MHAVETDNLTKVFRGKKGVRVEALKGLSLSIGSGEVFGFLGPNGAGKSTTIKTLMGLIRPSSGSAKIMGIPITDSAARRSVGYLPENPAFYDYLSAEEYLEFVGKSFDMENASIKERSEDVLRLLELWEARKRPMRGYSKGMVQRVGLAQVLLHEPQVYILDEPMSGLDPLGRALVKKIIIDLKSKGKTVFFSTHIIADVETVCDRVGIILNGELKAVERVDTIVAAGIYGYHLQARNIATGAVTERQVSREELPAALAELQADNMEIQLVDPLRESLEDFFLKVVEKGRV